MASSLVFSSTCMMKEVSRYDLPSGEHGEFEPGSEGRVLRNTRKIIEPGEVELVETELLAKAYVDSFDWATASLSFTEQIICEMHILWLGELYPIAGQYRSVNVSKGGFLFCPATQIEQEMKRFELKQLRTLTPCPTIPLDELALRVSIVHAELLLIHPFREGNGRLGRWLSDLMVLQAGYAAPDYDLNEEDKRAEYYSAMRKAYGEDFRALTALFEFWIRRAQ